MLLLWLLLLLLWRLLLSLKDLGLLRSGRDQTSIVGGQSNGRIGIGTILEWLLLGWWQHRRWRSVGVALVHDLGLLR